MKILIYLNDYYFKIIKFKCIETHDLKFNK